MKQRVTNSRRVDARAIQHALATLFVLCVTPWSTSPASASKPADRTDKATVTSAPREFAIGNFFSASAAAAVQPSVDKRAGPNDPIGKELVDQNPTLEQMRLIPSLDEPQRKQLNDLFNIYRSDLKLLRDQLKAKRDEFKGRTEAENNVLKETTPESLAKEFKDLQDKVPPPTEQTDPSIVVLIDQIKNRRTLFAQALQKLVRPEQMQELELLKRGKVPAYAE